MSYLNDASLESTVSAADTVSVAPPAVLTVDDRPANLIALEAILDRLPARIVRARSGAEALARAGEQEFAVALLDWQMPEMDGIEAARRMRAQATNKQPPIIILTAYLPERDEIKAAYSVGVVDFLQKPYPPEVLLAKVSVFVELYVQREKLRLYERALRERFAEDLVGIVSHDLRTPLNAISLAARSMLGRTERDESDRRLLRIIRSSAGRAGRMVHDLLDYTQVLQGGAPALQRARFCLLGLTHEILEELRASFPSAQFVVEHTGSTEGLWDRDRLAQVIANLVGNAATYGSGGPIVVRLAGDAAGMTIEVRNQGEPIPEALIPQLFEARRRGSTHRRHGSIGLGLFIVREMVRAHSGSVAVQSGAAGTTFSVTLPASADESGIRIVSPPAIDPVGEARLVAC
jgi:signal transduction histidine kinase